MTGTLSGLTTNSWSLLAPEPKQGTFTTTHTNEATAARLKPSNLNAYGSFTQTSGTIKFNGSTGSVNLKMIFNYAIEASRVSWSP